MTGLDTNILVRFIAQDDPAMSGRAEAIMQSLSVEEPGWIALTALAEFSWVMTRRFRVSRAGVHAMLSHLLAKPEIVIEQADLVRTAADLFLHGNADFSDYLIACSAREAGCKRTLTFDRKAAKSAGMILA